MRNDGWTSEATRSTLSALRAVGRMKARYSAGAFERALAMISVRKLRGDNVKH